MNRIERTKNTLFYTLAGGIYAFAVGGAALTATYMHQLSAGWILQRAFVLAALFSLLFYSGRTALATLGVLALGGGGVALYLGLAAEQPVWAGRLIILGRELWGHVQGYLPYSPRYEVLAVAIVGGIALAAVLLARTRAGFYLLALGGLGALGALGLMGYTVPQIYRLSILFILVVLLARRLGRLAARHGGDLALNISGLLLLPVGLAVLLLATLLPQPAAASGRNLKDNAWANIQALEEYLYQVTAPRYFDFSTTGFSGGGGRLGGNVRPNDRYVMEVFAQGDRWPYLAGAYWDVYEGDRWANRPAQTELALRLDGWPAPGWFWTAPGEPNIEAMGRANAVVAILPGRETRAVFTPARSWGLLYQKDWAAYSRAIAGAQVDFAHPLALVSGDEAGAGLVEQSMAEAQFSRVGESRIQAGQPMPAGSVYAVAYGEGGTLTPSMGGADGAALTEPYLALPDDLPQRVRDLAEAITQGLTSPHKKMAALEGYLQRFPYTLEPGPLPRGADLVDWFLFEGQKGYCTYYASALAVMGRCVGVPTRYAEGFMLPSEKNERDGYNVTNAQAHAWCEALLPGLGWTGFEATAPYAYSFYHGGEQAPAHPTGPQEPEFDDVPRFEEDDLMAQVREEQATQPPATQPPGEDEGGAGAGLPGWLLLILALLVAAAAGVAGLRYWGYQRALERLRAQPNREAAIAWFGRIIGLMTAQGRPMLAGESAAAFGRRMDNALSAQGRLARLAEIFCRARYSLQEISDDERREMAEWYERLLMPPGAPLRRRVQAWVERYVLGRY